MSDPFWLNDPTVLLKPTNFLPNSNMTNTERLNALTRILVVITIILAIGGYKHALIILIAGVVVILFLRFTDKPVKEGFQPHRGNHMYYGFDSSMPHINTRYEESPIQQFNHLNYGVRSYTNAKYKVVPIDTPAPAREIWQNQPNYYREFTQYPRPYDVNYQPTPRRYFESSAHVENTPIPTIERRESAMPAVESAYMRDSMEYRNNIMGQIVEFYEKQRQHNCVGFQPGRKTF